MPYTVVSSSRARSGTSRGEKRQESSLPSTCSNSAGQDLLEAPKHSPNRKAILQDNKSPCMYNSGDHQTLQGAWQISNQTSRKQAQCAAYVPEPVLPSGKHTAYTHTPTCTHTQLPLIQLFSTGGAQHLCVIKHTRVASKSRSSRTHRRVEVTDPVP